MSAAIHLLTESVQSLAQAAREMKPLRAGRPVHPSALWRWSRHGVNTPLGRVTLETVYLAGRVVTSREAVLRFLRGVAEAKAGRPDAQSPGVLALRPSPTHAAAKARLDRAGIRARAP